MPVMDNRILTHASVALFDIEEGRFVLAIDDLDFDNAEAYAAAFCQLIDAAIIEKQMDADLMSWLVDFEGVQFMLKAEHYSASLWLERLGAEGDDELSFLNHWLSNQLLSSHS
ncbi:hypothetical protein BCT30_12950 [Enterovibrio norvegicus]|uniref:DUF3630 family protein n=2 Tax=Enterovibrio norvegicus TaxID=188144 RepID=UPI0002D96026|nr:DUF3630 family protein [Enterovibrio norvegicus]MCC4797473.1 DUF3630 family protein [Enterovibrio norvegicus]OEE43730.1 hypothetical protein A1OS_09915 [Enterovibrio norvegicus]PMI32829.1 hypothetical protein BCU47_11270 [Enterovibrio norvegicus]PMI41683.1 hypothetical protein BCU46_04355 [Enterovibrio norvegicus]PMN52528.1 hypothetical protein BCT30_12950 [Enterovibrio norvegicus]